MPSLRDDASVPADLVSPPSYDSSNDPHCGAKLRGPPRLRLVEVALRRRDARRRRQDARRGTSRRGRHAPGHGSGRRRGHHGRQCRMQRDGAGGVQRAESVRPAEHLVLLRRCRWMRAATVAAVPVQAGGDHDDRHPGSRRRMRCGVRGGAMSWAGRHGISRRLRTAGWNEPGRYPLLGRGPVRVGVLFSHSRQPMWGLCRGTGRRHTVLEPPVMRDRPHLFRGGLRVLGHGARPDVRRHASVWIGARLRDSVRWRHGNVSGGGLGRRRAVRSGTPARSRMRRRSLLRLLEHEPDVRHLPGAAHRHGRRVVQGRGRSGAELRRSLQLCSRRRQRRMHLACGGRPAMQHRHRSRVQHAREVHRDRDRRGFVRDVPVSAADGVPLTAARGSSYRRLDRAREGS